MNLLPFPNQVAGHFTPVAFLTAKELWALRPKGWSAIIFGNDPRLCEGYAWNASSLKKVLPENERIHCVHIGPVRRVQDVFLLFTLGR